MDKTHSGDELSKTAATNEQNPNSPNTTAVQQSETNDRGVAAAVTSRTPFTDLSQVDADLALARTLQEQERAYMMLTVNNTGGDYVSWEAGNHMHEGDDDDDFEDTTEEEYNISEAEYDNYEEEVDAFDAFDVHAHPESEYETDSESGDGVSPGAELDPASFPNDEAYARALQDAEDRDMAATLLAAAGLNDMVVAEAEESEEEDDESQVSWPEVDPDELSYEELIALSEVVGTQNKGLSADTIASLTSTIYKSESNQGGSGTSESCVVCRFDYEDGETLTVLSCKHSYHSECINNWLRINKVCPVCSAEVCAPGTN